VKFHGVVATIGSFCECVGCVCCVLCVVYVLQSQQGFFFCHG